MKVLKTCYRSESDNSLTSEAGGYSFGNHTDNRSYSLIAEALYSSKLRNGDLNVGVYYQYKNLDQKYNHSEKSTVGTHKEYVYADYGNAAGRLSYTVGMGLENNHYRTATDDRFDYLVLRPSLALNVQYDRHSAMRLTAAVNSSVPNVGDLTGSVVAIDEHFKSQDNTALKPYHYYYADLGYQYASDNGKLYVAPSVTCSYYPHRNMPVLLTQADDIILRMTRIDNVRCIGASLSVNCRATDWLAVRPFYNYERSAYRTPDRAVKHHLHNAGIGLQLQPKKWQLAWNGNFPMTLAEGDIFTRKGFNMSATAIYRLQSVSAGLEYVFNPDPKLCRHPELQLLGRDQVEQLQESRRTQIHLLFLQGQIARPRRQAHQQCGPGLGPDRNQHG